jgi:23S rRNA pseudouridine2605 synthase
MGKKRSKPVPEQTRAKRLPDDLWQPERAIGLGRALAKAGYGTRSHTEAMVRAGRVTVDDEQVTDPATPVAPGCVICLDGELLTRVVRRYFAFHKPPRILTSSSDRGGRRLASEFFPDDVPGLRPAGRLDANTSGLLLVSNDASWNSVAAAAPGLEKEYQIQIAGRLSPMEPGIILAGMHLPNHGYIRPTQLRILDQSDTHTILRLVVVEGRNRQIRRIFGLLRHTVVYLRRIRIGPVKLGNLPSGRLRPLTPQEISAILSARARP